MKPKLKKLKGYILICTDNGLAYDNVIAYNSKQAKDLMLNNCADWIKEDFDYFIKYYAKWVKNANITGLVCGQHLNDVELIKRNFCTSLEYATCPICKKEDISVSQINDNIICCEECEENLT